MDRLLTLLTALEGLLRSFGTESKLRSLGADGQAATVNLAFGGGDSRTAAEDSIRQTIVLFLRAQIGERYQYAIEHSFDEADPEGWDCSELAENAYNRAGLAYPDGCVNQKPYVEHRPVLEPRAGDPSFLGPNAKGIPHTGLYDGQGGVIHALGGKGVTVWPLSQWMAHPRYKGFFRHPDLAYPPEERA